jgi:hypothetical protein
MNMTVGKSMRILALILGLVAMPALAADPVVLPPGITQVGLSADENATGGNNATRIGRDGAGHVHLVWVDSGRQGAATGPVYRRLTVAPDGAVTFETDPVYLADKTPGDWNAYPALAVTSDAVYVVWQGGGVAHVRRLAIGPSGYTWGPIVDTGAKSEGRDIGPAIQAFPGGGVRVVTPSGQFAVSTDGGKTWKADAVPLPAGQRVKTISLTTDPAGDTILAFSSVVTDPKEEGKAHGTGGYWQLRTIRRTAAGQWTDAQDVLGAFPGWAPPVGANDSLADWVRIAADDKGGLHLTWHGTGISHIYGNDQAYYAYRPQGGTWQEPVPLVRRDDAAGIRFSFAPSLTLDGEEAIATVFYDIYDGDRWAGFDADLVAFKNGARVGPVLPLSHFVRQSIADKRPAAAFSTRFPSAAPTPYRAGSAVWLDAVETFIPMGVPGAPKSIVYHRVDIGSLLHP